MVHTGKVSQSTATVGTRRHQKKIGLPLTERDIAPVISQRNTPSKGGQRLQDQLQSISKGTKGAPVCVESITKPGTLLQRGQLQSSSSGQRRQVTLIDEVEKGKFTGVNSSIVEGWKDSEDDDVRIDSDERESDNERENNPQQAGATAAAAVAPSLDEALKECSELGSKGDDSISIAVRMQGKEPAETVAEKDDSGAANRVILTRAAALRNDPPLSYTEEQGLNTIPEEFKPAPATVERDTSVELEDLEREELVATVKGPANPFLRNSDGGRNKRLCARQFRREFNARTIESRKEVRLDTATMVEGRMRGSIKGDAKEGKKSSELKSAKEKASEEGVSSAGSPAVRQRRTPLKKRSEEDAGKNVNGHRPARDERARKLALMARQRKELGVGEPAKTESDTATLAAEGKSSLRDRAVLANPTDDTARKKSRIPSESGSRGIPTNSASRGTPTNSSSSVKTKRTKKEEVSPLKVVVGSKRTRPKRGIDKETRPPDQASTRRTSHQSASKDKQQVVGLNLDAPEGHVRELVSEEKLESKRQKTVDVSLKNMAVPKGNRNRSSSPTVQNDIGHPKMLLSQAETAWDGDQDAVRLAAPLTVGVSELKEAAMEDNEHREEDSDTSAGAEDSAGGLKALGDVKEAEPLNLQPRSDYHEPPESLPRVHSCGHHKERQDVQADKKIEKQSVQENCHVPLSPKPASQSRHDAVHCPITKKPVAPEKQDEFEMMRDDNSDSDAERTDDSHNSYCERCKLGGELLCCDGSGCKVTYHLDCTEPKLSKVPSDNWYCPTCSQKCVYFGPHSVPLAVESIWDVRVRGDRSGYPVPSIRISKGTDIIDRDDSRFSDQIMRTSLTACASVSGRNGSGLEECSDVVGAGGDGKDEKSPTAEIVSKKQGTQRLDGGLTLQSCSEKQSDEDASTGKCDDREYFVKWKGISHAHNAWITEADLGKLSPKCLANFKRKLAEGQVGPWNPEWIEPQRLVDKRCISSRRSVGEDLDSSDQQEWFVKWKGLGYEHCTWEILRTSLCKVPRLHELEIMHEKWKQNAHQRRQPQEIEKAKTLREANFQLLESKPDWFHMGQLLPYQLDRLNHLRQRWHSGQNTLVEDEDYQETLSTIVFFILSLIEEYGVCSPILVVVPLFDIQRWEAEILEYAPHLNAVVYVGSREARGIIQQYELNTKKILQVQVVLTTYDVAYSEVDHVSSIEWEALIVYETQQAKATKFRRASLKISATFLLFFVNDVSKYNVEELLQMLCVFCTKDRPSTADIRKSLIGLEESAHLRYLQDQLRQHMVKDWKPDDSSGLELKEMWIGTNMTPLQRRLYCKALIKSYPVLHYKRLRGDRDCPSLQDLVKSLWTCCQHPYLYDPKLQELDQQGTPPSHPLIEAGIEASEKWQLIDAMLSILHSEGHRAVIISQALKQLYFFDDYLRQKYGPKSYELIDTRNSTLRKNAAIQNFNAKDSSRFVLLLRAGASGFRLKLKDKDVVIMHGSDLNPANDSVYLRKVLHKGGGDLMVFRIYQRCTIEEGSMVYFHQQKLEADSKPLSFKILQHLLRWKVQYLLESSSGITSIPEEKKLTGDQVLERAKNILQGNGDNTAIIAENFADEGSAEEDADSVKEFWSMLLKDKYTEILDDEEVLTIGKGLRHRKKVQYSEEALASASYSVAVGEESTRQKRKRSHLLESSLPPVSPDHAGELAGQSFSRRTEGDTDELGRGTQKDAAARTDHAFVSIGADTKNNAQVESAEPYSEPVVHDRSSEQQVPAPDDSAVLTKSPAKVTMVSSKVKTEGELGHDPSNAVQLTDATPAAADIPSVIASELDNWRTVRVAQKQQLLIMEPEVSEICGILHLSEDIANYCKQLLSFVMAGYRMPLEPPELVVLVEIALCAVSASKFRIEVDHELALSRVGEKMKLSLSTDEFPSAYARVDVMFKAYERQEADLQKSVYPEAANTGLPQSAADLAPHPGLTTTPDSLKIADQTSVAKENSGLQASRQLLEETAGESQQQSRIGDWQGTATQAKDRTGQGSAEHDTIRSERPGSSQDQHNRQQSLIAPLATVHRPSSESENALRARLKADKDRLIRMCIMKQKDEVNELNAAVGRDRARLQTQHEKEKSQVMGMSAAVERLSTMLRTLEEDYASKCKVQEEGAEAKRRELSSNQRVLRDNVNALYMKMLGQVAAGKELNLISEAQKVGLTNFTESSASKNMDYRLTQTAQANQAGPSHGLQNIQATSSSQSRQHDAFEPTFGGGQTPAGAPNQRHPQTQLQPELHRLAQVGQSPQLESQSPLRSQSYLQLQPQSRLQTQHQHQVQSHSQSQQQVQPLSQRQQTTQQQQQVQTHSQPQQLLQSRSLLQQPPMSRSQPLSEPQFYARLPSHPHFQHQTLQADTQHQLQLQPQGQLSVQHRPQSTESPVSSLAVPHGQAILVQQPLHHQVQTAASAEQAVLQPRYSQHSSPSWSPGHTHPPVSGSGVNTSASALIPNVGPHGLGTELPAIDQRSLQPLMAQLSRPMAHGSTSLQGRVSLAPQTASNVHTVTGPAPASLRPGALHTLQNQTNVQVRVSPSVQTSPNPQARGSTSQQSMVSNLVDAPGNLQHRSGQVHRQSSQQPTRFSHQLPTARVQNQSHQSVGVGAGISTSGSSAPGGSTRAGSSSGLPAQIVAASSTSSQGQSEINSLTGEQRRLILEQEGVFRTYLQEARNEKAQYDRRVAELYTRHRGAVGQQYEAAQQEMRRVSNKLALLVRSRELAGAFAMRGHLDNQRGRSAAQGHGTGGGGTAGGRGAAHGRGGQVPGSHSHGQGRHDAGRGNGPGTNYGAGPPLHVGPGANPCGGPPLRVNPRGPTTPVNSANNQSRARTWQNSNSNSFVNSPGQNGNLTGLPSGEISAGALSHALNVVSMRGFRSSSVRPGLDCVSQAAPSLLSDSPSRFQNAVGRQSQSNTLSSHLTAASHQRFSWPSRQNAGNFLMAPSSIAGVRQQFDDDSSTLIAASRAETALASTEELATSLSLILPLADDMWASPDNEFVLGRHHSSFERNALSMEDYGDLSVPPAPPNPINVGPESRLTIAQGSEQTGTASQSAALDATIPSLRVPSLDGPNPPGSPLPVPIIYLSDDD